MYSVEFDSSSAKKLYVQIYEFLKKELADGRIVQGERLPSVRNMAKMLGVSVTTVRTAYDQLIVEGYLESRPQSGFYVMQGSAGEQIPDHGRSQSRQIQSSQVQDQNGNLMFDPDSFDFVKWKKCISGVLNDTPELLLSEADRQGEPALRAEIASYLYKSRGVVCDQEQVVISAGTQQLVNHIARILKMMGIGHVCTEDPGYTPVRSIFRDWGFSLSSIPVRKDGIVIEKLPMNIRTAVYVSPQNQFPTGAVMPIGRRHRLLEWADDNDSIIIEDDYDSELRYFGMPVPALQGLDGGKRVVYIGSFTSTLFPAVRISYMVLPPGMAEMYETVKRDYDQTCSKTEQLTLALFMQRGFYDTNLKKIRNLYSHKLREAVSAIKEFGSCDGFTETGNTQSGINIILRINTEVYGISEGAGEYAPRLVEAASSLGIKAKLIEQLNQDSHIYLIFYYNQIPIGDMRESVKRMIEAFRQIVSHGSNVSDERK